ncbi:unnamed protein product, partial [Discosporangium mesarthrocarpum]
SPDATPASNPWCNGVPPQLRRWGSPAPPSPHLGPVQQPQAHGGQARPLQDQPLQHQQLILPQQPPLHSYQQQQPFQHQQPFQPPQHPAQQHQHQIFQGYSFMPESDTGGYPLGQQGPCGSRPGLGPGQGLSQGGQEIV